MGEALADVLGFLARILETGAEARRCSRDRCCCCPPAGEVLALFDVLAEVQLHAAQGDALVLGARRRGQLLQHFELDGAVGQVVVAVDGDPDRHDLGVVVGDPVGGLVHGAFPRPAAVLGVHRVREVPFYVGGSRDQWHVVQVVYGEVKLEFRLDRKIKLVFFFCFFCCCRSLVVR